MIELDVVKPLRYLLSEPVCPVQGVEDGQYSPAIYYGASPSAKSDDGRLGLACGLTRELHHPQRALPAECLVTGVEILV